MISSLSKTVVKQAVMPLSFLKKLGYPWSCNHLPGFRLNGKQIEILNEPSAFYDTLLRKCQTAEKRIVIASLYLGTGKLEAKLVSAIQQRLSERKDLNVSLLLDCTRGSRQKDSSRISLLPMLQNYSDRCQISLYHTPKLRGFLKSILPNRYNEIVGLQHMKLYVFDDDLIISGANLSQDYFTQRQDRYMVVQGCRPLADFAANLCERVADFSFRLNSNNELHMDAQWSIHFMHKRLQEFVDRARDHVWGFYLNVNGNMDDIRMETSDTIIYPFLEMGQFNIHQESLVTQKLLECCPEKTNVRIATGYFNITDAYADSIVEKSHAHFQLLMAHPTANGFFNAKGPAGGIPKGYSELAGRFFDVICAKGQANRIRLLEYVRQGWTFHAKGLWLFSKYGSLSLIGSSNFGERSVHRDLECQFLIATTNPALQLALQQECNALFSYGTPYTSVERCRKPPQWVRLVLLLFKNCL